MKERIADADDNREEQRNKADPVRAMKRERRQEKQKDDSGDEASKPASKGKDGWEGKMQVPSNGKGAGIVSVEEIVASFVRNMRSDSEGECNPG